MQWQLGLIYHHVLWKTSDVQLVFSPLNINLSLVSYSDRETNTSSTMQKLVIIIVHANALLYKLWNFYCKSAERMTKSCQKLYNILKVEMLLWKGRDTKRIVKEWGKRLLNNFLHWDWLRWSECAATKITEYVI